MQVPENLKSFTKKETFEAFESVKTPVGAAEIRKKMPEISGAK